MKLLFIGIVLHLSFNFNGYAISKHQPTNEALKTELVTLKIQTSAVCDMCEQNLQQVLIFEKGIKSVSLNPENFVLTVVYNPRKTNPEEIRKKISSIGYDADDVKADKKAFEKLNSCCKVPH